MAGVGTPGSRGCVPGLGTDGTPTRFCVGSSSAVDEITSRDTVTPMLKLLGSVRETDTGEVTGVDAVTFHGRDPVVLSGNALPDAIGSTALFGRGDAPAGDLPSGAPEAGGSVHLFQGASISDYAATHPQPAATLGGLPGSTVYASDPSDVASYQGTYAVTDAGANDLVEARLTPHGAGRVTLLARFPTTSETAPAGLIGQAPVAVVTGLTGVSDLAFSRSGQLLILESNTGGALAPANTGGALLTATLDGTTPVTATNLQVPGLVDPTGLAIGTNGDAYITDDTTGAHRGEIVRVSQLG